MRTIEYFGHTLEVPDEVNYIAKDGNGEVWGYPDEPCIAPCGEMFDSEVGGKFLSLTIDIKDWQDSVVCLENTKGLLVDLETYKQEVYKKLSKKAEEVLAKVNDTLRSWGEEKLEILSDGVADDLNIYEFLGAEFDFICDINDGYIMCQATSPEGFFPLLGFPASWIIDEKEIVSYLRGVESEVEKYIARNKPDEDRYKKLKAKLGDDYEEFLQLDRRLG